MYVCEQTFCKLWGQITQKLLEFNMRNFQGIFLYEHEHVWRFSNMH